jgi:hypothetical protein
MDVSFLKSFIIPKQWLLKLLIGLLEADYYDSDDDDRSVRLL